MNEQNYLRMKMVQALQNEPRMLAEGNYLKALDSRGDYRKYRQELLKLWGDRKPAQNAV
ncbi:hypothetical protein E6C60_3069 [Paenibacillus algicola]|uniref:Uncharacterized protein n=1 Tax=Paenibacillus algicola TaxID=2565926 RepID=A0A4P8XPS3_9BACL|nr:hypothetical protein [Paenibacillus algicola]QCT03780.1 hypothetical protein E6C60_3069 [Paenibacillus algicola]